MIQDRGIDGGGEDRNGAETVRLLDFVTPKLVEVVDLFPERSQVGGVAIEALNVATPGVAKLRL